MTHLVAPYPTYAPLTTLREALSSGQDLVGMWAVDIARLIADDVTEDERQSEAHASRHFVERVLAGDPSECPPVGTPDSGYVVQWPSQTLLQGHQWGAELMEDPGLLPAVYLRLPNTQRREVDEIAEAIRQGE